MKIVLSFQQSNFWFITSSTKWSDTRLSMEAFSWSFLPLSHWEAQNSFLFPKTGNNIWISNTFLENLRQVGVPTAMHMFGLVFFVNSKLTVLLRLLKRRPPQTTSCDLVWFCFWLMGFLTHSECAWIVFEPVFGQKPHERQNLVWSYSLWQLLYDL